MRWNKQTLFSEGMERGGDGIGLIQLADGGGKVAGFAHDYDIGLCL